MPRAVEPEYQLHRPDQLVHAQQVPENQLQPLVEPQPSQM